MEMIDNNGGGNLIPDPQQVNFNSNDFYNILQWQEASHTSKSTVYVVQYKMYGEKQWKNKTECWEISQPFCDLTHETKDFMEPHFARVQALTTNGHSNWVLSERFIPFWETAIGPPKIKLTPQARSVVVKLFVPRTPFRRKKGSWVTLEEIYSGIEYQLEITGNPLDHDKITDNQREKSQTGGGVPDIKVLTPFESRELELDGEDMNRSCSNSEVVG
ncbi:interleukin-22 receptor subunit alpha-2-like [Cetorhinus maximus]